MPRPRRSAPKYRGDALTKFRRTMLRQLGSTCWLCGKPGADTLDHVVPRSVAPELAFDPGNVRPAHRSCNSGRGNRPAPVYEEAVGW